MVGALAILVAVLLTGCGSNSPATASFTGAGPSAIPRSLLTGERPIGRGARFQPALRGDPAGACTAELGPRMQAHIELFGANRVVLLSAGIGTGGPRRFLDGRLLRAGCFGAIVTLDPTGTVYFRAGAPPSLATLFREWGHPLTPNRAASFTGRVRVYIDGRRSTQSPGAVRLDQDAEIVLEVGPYVPPHTRFAFPRRPSATLH